MLSAFFESGAADMGLMSRRRKAVKYWVVAVTKHQNGEGYLITAYQTDNRKEGDVVWRR